MKLWIRRVLNLLLWLNVCLLSGTGFALYWRLPHGREGGRGLELWGMDRHEWGELHAIAGIVFAVLILAHMVMAWPWLKNAAAKRKLWPVWMGLTAGVALCLVIFLGPIDKRTKGDGHGSGRAWQDSIE